MDAPCLVSFADQERKGIDATGARENARNEQTPLLCSNKGVEHQNNASMKGFVRSGLLTFHR